jgi:hypothetical protein
MKKLLAIFLLLASCSSAPKVQSTRQFQTQTSKHVTTNDQITDAVTQTTQSKKNDVEVKTEVIKETAKEVTYTEGPKTITEISSEIKKESTVKTDQNNVVVDTKVPDPPSNWINNKFFWGQMFLLLAVLLFSGWIFYREFLRKDQDEEESEESALKKPVAKTPQKKKTKKVKSR